MTSTPSPSAASATSAPAQRAHLAPPHPRHEEESRDHGVEATPLEPPTRPLGGQRGHPSGSMSNAADERRRLRIGLEDLRTRGSSGTGQTRRPPLSCRGKRGQQVRRWLERRGRRTVRPQAPSRLCV